MSILPNDEVKLIDQAVGLLFSGSLSVFDITSPGHA